MPTDRRGAVESLRGFGKDKRVGCTVCALPHSILTQIDKASSHRIRLEDQLQWLGEGGYPKVTRENLLRHRRAGH